MLLCLAVLLILFGFVGCFMNATIGLLVIIVGVLIWGLDVMETLLTKILEKLQKADNEL